MVKVWCTNYSRIKTLVVIQSSDKLSNKKQHGISTFIGITRTIKTEEQLKELWKDNFFAWRKGDV